MKILITGSNGMLGSELCEQLIEMKLDVYATSLGENRITFLESCPNFHFIELDITDSIATRYIIESTMPDVIIHAAAMTQVDDCELNKTKCLSINVEGTKNILHVAEDLNCRFIYISTDFVFSGDDGPYSEGDEAKPVNFYGQSKLLAEELVSQSDAAWSIVRTVLLYGKTEKINRSNFIYWVRDNLQANKPIQVVNDQIRTPTYIPDLVKGIITIAERSIEGVFHLSGNEIITPYQLALKVANKLDLNPTLIQEVDSSTFSQPGKRPLKTGFYIDKARQKLGFIPTSIDNALSQIFD